MPQPSKRPSRLVSPIVWLGGKGRNWQWVISHFPEHRVYIEPFGGGASVLLNKPPVDVEVYNDLDLRVYHLFAMLRCKRQSRQLIHQLRLTPYHEHEYSLAWSGDLSKDPTERARQIFVQLRMAFGGLGSRGVRPGFGFGKTSSKSKSFLSCIEQLGNIVERLRSVTVMCRCGIDVIKRFDGPDTLHYCDPPYVQSSRAKGAGYLHEMSDDDHCRLAEVLNNAKGKVVLSGYPSQLYDRLYHGWRQVTRDQSLLCSRQKGGRRTEVLWMNY